MTAVDSFAGPRVELARYLTTDGERVIYAVRVGGIVVSDWPADGPGRAFVIERGVSCERELYALVTDYVDQSIERVARDSGRPAGLRQDGAHWMARSAVQLRRDLVRQRRAEA